MYCHKLNHLILRTSSKKVSNRETYRLHEVILMGPCVLSISNAMLKKPHPGESKIFLCFITHHTLKTYGAVVVTGQHNFNLNTGWKWILIRQGGRRYSYRWNENNFCPHWESNPDHPACSLASNFSSQLAKSPLLKTHVGPSFINPDLCTLTIQYWEGTIYELKLQIHVLEWTLTCLNWHVHNLTNSENNFSGKLYPYFVPDVWLCCILYTQ
jgi:hypothetical protein